MAKAKEKAPAKAKEEAPKKAKVEKTFDQFGNEEPPRPVK